MLLSRNDTAVLVLHEVLLLEAPARVVSRSVPHLNMRANRLASTTHHIVILTRPLTATATHHILVAVTVAIIVSVFHLYLYIRFFLQPVSEFFQTL